MKKSLIPASRLLYSPLTKGTGCNGGSCNTARAAPGRLLAGVPYAQPTIQLVAVTARAAASPRLVNSHASTYATPKKFHGVCLIPFKFTVAQGKNTPAHCNTFRLFVVDIILP